jgi:hypothetical protein
MSHYRHYSKIFIMLSDENVFIVSGTHNNIKITFEVG